MKKIESKMCTSTFQKTPSSRSIATNQSNIKVRESIEKKSMGHTVHFR